MAKRLEGAWAEESRIDRLNSESAGGFSELPGDGATGPTRRRRKRRSWFVSMALPIMLFLLVVVGLILAVSKVAGLR